MSSGITSIVDQLLGASRIPASAAPLTLESKTGPKPKPEKPRKVTRHERLIAAISEEWQSIAAITACAGVSTAFGYANLPAMAATGVAEVRIVPWAKGVRREYRRVR